LELNEPDFLCFQGDGIALTVESDGYISEDALFKVTDDFIVPGGTNFEMQQIRMNLLGFEPLESMTFDFVQSENGLP